MNYKVCNKTDRFWEVQDPAVMTQELRLPDSILPQPILDDDRTSGYHEAGRRYHEAGYIRAIWATFRAILGYI